MMLYDVFYHYNAFDRDVPLPDPIPEMKYAQNTNWDKHILYVKRTGDKVYEWVRSDQLDQSGQ